MSKKELEKLAGDVSKALESQAKEHRAEALKAAEAAAAKFGFTLSELVGKPKAAKRKAAAKYKNPGNASETWSGRGRQPAWFKAEIAKGTDPDNMLA